MSGCRKRKSSPSTRYSRTHARARRIQDEGLSRSEAKECSDGDYVDSATAEDDLHGLVDGRFRGASFGKKTLSLGSDIVVRVCKGGRLITYPRY